GDARQAAAEAARMPGPEAWSGTETILLAEDEEAVRRFAAEALEAKGYRVLKAGNGREAMALLESGTEKVQLVLTDVVMPDMGGGELADRIKRSHPDLPVLYMSGYTENA